MKFTRLTATFLLAVAPSMFAMAGEKVVNVYNWSDYIAEDTISNFEAATGIKVVYDVYDSNEILEAKLFAGQSGYDVVFPSMNPFAGRHIAAGLYRPLDKTLLPHSNHIDEKVLGLLNELDPGNQYVMPYMWGTTGVGYNEDKVKAALGENVELNTWGLVFNPEYAKKLKNCGIALMDDEQEVIVAALIYMGKDANTTDPKDIEAAADMLKQIRPYVKYFHSSQYINDLANGDICVAHGYSGDVIQARDRAEEANSGANIKYIIPKEGAVVWVDVMAVPADAPHPEEAHAFIDYLMQPEVIAGVSNYVAYANANKDAASLMDEAITSDEGIYPSEEVRKNLTVLKQLPDKLRRLRTRTWTRVKTGQ